MLANYGKYVISSLIVFSLSCSCEDLCGPGEYKCYDIFSVSPQIHPLKYDISNGFILFEDGWLWKTINEFEKAGEINLTEVCSTDSVRDIAHYNNWLTILNYFYADLDILLPPEYYFRVVLSANKCSKLDPAYNFLFDFGNVGPDSQRILDGRFVDVNFEGKIFVIDSGDNSVKIFDIDGNFIDRWQDIGTPSFIKIYEDIVYILDTSSNTIMRYDYQGNPLGPFFQSDAFSDIKVFGFASNSALWISDMNGARMLLVYYSGNIKEEKREYCLNDQTFLFQNIVYIDAYSKGFRAVDYNANAILAFASTLRY